MFELVVFIITAAIIYATAANRFNEFPGEAERANFLAVTTQLQSAVNLELMLAMTTGQRHLLSNYENANPMSILLETPSNYIGAYDAVDVLRLPRRSWYFDLQRGELVYLVNNSENTYLVYGDTNVPTDEIRFRMQLAYRDGLLNSSEPSSESDSGALGGEAGEIPRNSSKRVTGMLLKPVVPYLWSPTEAQLDTLALSEQAS